MKQPRSIFRNLLVRLLAFILLAPVLASVEVLIVGEQGPDQRTDAAQERQADAIAALLRIDNRQRLQIDSRAMERAPDLRNLRIAVYGTKSSEPILLWPAGLALRTWDEFGGYDTVRRVGGRTLRLFLAPGDRWGAWFDWYSDELTDEMLPMVAILMGVTLPLSLLTIRRGLAPVRGLAREAEQIQPGENHARLSERDVPLELLQLVRNVNSGLERLDAGFAAQQRFSSIVAHELRTPLAILLMQLERGPATAEIVEAKRQVQRMCRLVDQLLTISELSARRLKLDSNVDLVAVARDTIAQEVPRALDSRVTIALEAPDMPFALKGNAAAIGAALRNLINNAVRHSPQGSDVLVRLFPSEHALEVSDKGSGIEPAARKNIFEPFWKSPASKGAGVGLAIVQEMAELHGGNVSVRDNVPRGSIFRIEFARPDKTAFCSG